MSSIHFKSAGNQNNQTLTPTGLLADGFDFSFTGTITATESGMQGNEGGTVSDGALIDWVGGALNVGKQGNTTVHSA